MKSICFLLLCALSSVHGAAIVTKPVSYEQGGSKLEGFLTHDSSATAGAKRPGVLVIHEWWGLNDYVKGRAQQLAEMGYVAFALDMYGEPATTDPKKAGELAGRFYGKPLMAERARAGLDQLLKTGLVDEQKVVAIGFCFGGSTAQAMAYSGAPLGGIVSFQGGLLPAPADAAQKTKAKFLILNGAIDPMVKQEDAAAFRKSLDAAKIDYQFIDYSGALHAFSNPNATRIGEENNLPAIGYNEFAARRAWAHMRLFFDEVFGPR